MREVSLVVRLALLHAGSAAAQSVPTVPEQVAVLVSGSTVTASVPNTFGNDATVATPFSQQVVDAVYLTVTNPAIGLVGSPVGLDDLVLWPR